MKAWAQSVRQRKQQVYRPGSGSPRGCARKSRKADWRSGGQSQRGKKRTRRPLRP